MFFFIAGSPFESTSNLFGLAQLGHSIVTNPSQLNDDALIDVVDDDVDVEQEVVACCVTDWSTCLNDFKVFWTALSTTALRIEFNFINRSTLVTHTVSTISKHNGSLKYFITEWTQQKIFVVHLEFVLCFDLLFWFSCVLCFVLDMESGEFEHNFEKKVKQNFPSKSKYWISILSSISLYQWKQLSVLLLRLCLLLWLRCWIHF